MAGLLTVWFIFTIFSGTVSTWQGRMAGIGDPYGLLANADMDNFSLRLIYGLPLNGVSVDGEVAVAYPAAGKNASRIDTNRFQRTINNGEFWFLPGDSDYWKTYQSEQFDRWEISYIGAPPEKYDRVIHAIRTAV